MDLLPLRALIHSFIQESRQPWLHTLTQLCTSSAHLAKLGLCCDIPAARKRTCACRQDPVSPPQLLAVGRPARGSPTEKREPHIEVPEASQPFDAGRRRIDFRQLPPESGYDAWPEETAQPRARFDQRTKDRSDFDVDRLTDCHSIAIGFAFDPVSVRV
jgi:hypothetical protein